MVNIKSNLKDRVTMKNIALILITACCLFYSFEKKSLKRPINIVLIVADDLGYSDLGCFGSEISTPNIDSLAQHGQIFTNFYTAAACSPSRAMLLTGTDNHIAGLGDMAEHVPTCRKRLVNPAMKAYLNNKVVCVAQLLKDAGYHTYISGKWHLGLHLIKALMQKVLKDHLLCLMLMLIILFRIRVIPLFGKMITIRIILMVSIQLMFTPTKRLALLRT